MEKLTREVPVTKEETVGEVTLYKQDDGVVAVKIGNMHVVEFRVDEDGEIFMRRPKFASGPRNNIAGAEHDRIEIRE